MPTRTNTKEVTCPECGTRGTFRQHDHYIEENAEPANRTLEMACPNGCNLSAEQLEQLRTGRIA